MNTEQTHIKDVQIIYPQIYQDRRGFFMETYHQEKYKQIGIEYDFVQDNHSLSQKGTLRGLHYQIQHPQGKMVRVIVGEAFDVAVDLRRSSLTFGKWIGHILSAENKHLIWIPPGFAHGFLALSDWVEVLYKATDFYSPEYERCLLWNDPDIGIDWPIDNSMMLQLSEKDRKGTLFCGAEIYV